MNEQTPYLYLNFERNRERLEERLLEIRRIHGNRLFPQLHPDTNILDYFVETAFEKGAPGQYFLANTSLKDNYIDITVRPKRAGLLEKELPTGITLCLRGGLFPRQHPSPELVIDRVIDIFDAPRRSFELEVSAIPLLANNGERRDNLFTGRLMLQLPEISKKTREHLQHWKDYLEWKREIVESQLSGLRYFSAEMSGEQLSFRVATENEAVFETFERSLNRDELMAFPLRYSSDAWVFNYNRNIRSIPSVALGRFRKLRKVDSREYDAELRECPWPTPFVAELIFDLGEDDQAEFDESPPAQKEALRRFLLKKIPDEGFLAVSLVGEFTLIQRQSQSIRDLEMESGYAPFLSSWLFDISQANTPQITAPVDAWLMENINEEQQKAVKKILTAPDVALIQGPPGTGKTTVIGEAIYQLARQGKRVLLASQANLAVDNALEKLASVPEIRAIRLGRSHKFSPEGQEFAEDKVLKKFYSSISDYCDNNYLTAWRESDLQLEALRRQLEDIDAMASGMAALHSELAALDARRHQVSLQYLEAEKKRKEERQRLSTLAELKENLTQLIKLLHGQHEVDLLIPEKLLDLIWATIISSINQLRKYKIDLNPYWTENNGRYSATEKTRFVKEILKRWAELQSAIPQMEAEIERLEHPELQVRIDPEDRLMLNQLRQALYEAETALEGGDDTQLANWREIRRKIQMLENRTNLEMALYARFFNLVDKGKPFYERLMHPNLDKYKLLLILAHTVRALRSTEKRIARASELLIDNVRRIIAKINLPAPDDAPLKETAEAIQELSRSKSELEEAFRRQQEEIAGRLAKLQPGAGDGDSGAVMGDIRQSLQAQIAELEAARRPDVGFREKWEPFLQSWVQALNDPAQIENDNLHFIETYIDNCNVIGITCNENRRLLEGKRQSCFDVTIIDEVSKATPPELLMPMMLAKKSILVGDHRQLPPLFKEQEGSWLEVIGQSEEADVREPVYRLLTRENFYRFKDMVTASLFKTYFEHAPAAIKTTLLTQYRMHPQIMEVINHFYEYRLACGLPKPDEQRQHHLTIRSAEGFDFITPESHAVWVDSSRDPLNRPHYESQSGTSKVNFLEALLITELLQKMDAAYREQGYGGEKRKAVGVISFYGKQVAELRRRLRSLRLEALQVDVNTVDRFQGKERPIILVSLVRNTRSGMQSKTAFVTQFERINVAFSRAQELLVIFGARDMFAECEVELPLMDQPGMTVKKVYGEIIHSLNRKSNFWGSATVISPEAYKQQLGGRG
ncbi:MAG: AAA family ATPase [Calditrichaeota bacterium]|nr:AAA family ATPase [Calditrichota bacterium]